MRPAAVQAVHFSMPLMGSRLTAAVLLLMAGCCTSSASGWMMPLTIRYEVAICKGIN